MVLKFHVQHEQTAGLQGDKNQHSRESKMAAVTKNSETIKIKFYTPRFQKVGVYWFVSVHPSVRPSVGGGWVCDGAV